MAKKINTTTEMGYTGLIEWQGVIQQDFNRELRYPLAYKHYDEMRLNCPIVAALLLAIEYSIRGCKWQFTADDENDPRIEFLDEALAGMSTSWNDHISEVLTMLPFGFAPFEICYKRDGGRLVWQKFAIRGQDTVVRWLFDETGGLAGLGQQAAPTWQYVEIPIEKLVIYRTRVERNNPEGRSILRSAYIPYYFLKNIQQIEAIGIERDLAGLPVIHLPPGATTDETDKSSDASKANKIVRNLRNDEQAGLVLPNGWVVELMSTGGTRQFDTDKIIARYEQRILMSALAQFLMLGQQGVGSLALSRDQTDFFTMSVNATADIIADTFTAYPVKRLLELNGMDPDGIKLTHSPAGDVDLTKLSDFLQKAGSFVTWTSQDETWLRKAAGLPEVDIEQLDEEREAKKAQATALQQALQKSQEQKQQGQDEQQPPDEGADEEEQDMMSVDFFGGSNPPDDTKRRHWENVYKNVWRTYQDSQRKKVIKGIRNA